MGLLSIFKRHTDTSRGAAPNVSDVADAVQRARIRARQRLIGAAVLLLIGIVGFPLVFETQPRPIPINVPIETPPKDGVPALTMPARQPSVAPAAVPASALPVAEEPAASASAAPADVITESRSEAGRELATPSAAASAEASAAPKPVSPAAPVAASKPPVAPKPAPKPAAAPKPVAVPADSARAQALLEGKPDKGEKATESGRFVVQIGAFADAAAARETRVKAEKLGFKTYTQAATTSAGHRIRVRLGPFASRAEADKAMAKAHGAGLTAVVLTL
jgi:DedD protein